MAILMWTGLLNVNVQKLDLLDFKILRWFDCRVKCCLLKLRSLPVLRILINKIIILDKARQSEKEQKFCLGGLVWMM